MWMNLTDIEMRQRIWAETSSSKWFHIYEVQKVAEIMILHARMSVKTLKELEEVISTKELTVVILVGAQGDGWEGYEELGSWQYY